MYVESDHLGTPRAVIDPTRNTAIWNWNAKSEVFGNDPPNQDPDMDGTTFVFNMTPAQFGRVELLFHAALDRPAAERAKFLREQESDAELIAAVERLLACDQDGGDDPVTERLTEVARDLPLRTVGPYRLLRELGSGGMQPTLRRLVSSLQAAASLLTPLKSLPAALT